MVANVQHVRLEELFNAAINKHTPEERAAFLEDVCADNPLLRATIESLVKAHDEAGTFLDSAAVDTEATRIGASSAEPPGTRIGPYKILQQIGEGGFGIVYMAEQEEPVRRKVALKIIKLGMDTKQVIARFEAERQALALMDHPNIATVLDAGATETGRPYFVMELVKGIKITDYCNRNRLSTQRRLDLFLQVCHAVQHAHQKGIIHRDLKPSNVLVTLHDSQPVPKVIDFGIAKATSYRLTDKTLFTELHQFIGTPEYMSPDQAEISGLDVDTRTDIYSLGVLLYELLTGTTPLDAKTLRQASLGEIQRIIREVDPPKPSTRVATLATAGAELARQHQADRRALIRLIRGDLDWIVMKAIEKDRTRRYETAHELAADVQRHLNHEPVLAGPPRVTYKLRKFVQRNRVPVVASSLVAASLVCGLVLATAFFLQASRERDTAQAAEARALAAKARADQETRRSQRIADLLQDLFVSSDPQQALTRVADVEQTIQIAREVFGNDHGTVAATLSSRALQLQSAGELEAAERFYREALHIWRERYDDNVNVAETLRALGRLQLIKGDEAAAEETFRESTRITRALPGAETVMLAETLGLLAQVLVNRGEYGEAEDLLRDSLRIRKAVAPQQRLQIAVTTDALADVLIISDQYQDVEAIMPEVLAAWRQALPADSTLLARTLSEMAVYHLDRDELDTADGLLQEALAIYAAAPEPAMRQQTTALRAMFGILKSRNELAAAVPLAMGAVNAVQRVQDIWQGAWARRQTVDDCWELALDPRRDREEYEIALGTVRVGFSETPDDVRLVNVLGALQYRLGYFEEALLTLAQSGLDFRQQPEGPEPACVAFIAMAHHRLGHAAEAQAALERFRNILRQPEIARTAGCQALRAEAERLIGGAPERPTPAPDRGNLRRSEGP